MKKIKTGIFGTGFGSTVVLPYVKNNKKLKLIGIYGRNKIKLDTIKKKNNVEIFNNFKDQAKILNSYVDFFYFDVLSSVREISIATESISEFNKPFLIGAHISEGITLPSGEKLSEITKKIKIKNLLGLILACVSPENYEKNINEIKSIGFPFGFKINAFEKTKIQGGYTKNYGKSKSGNPNEFLGKRDDLTPAVLKNLAKKFINDGATIIGGCCETNPSHIRAFSELK